MAIRFSPFFGRSVAATGRFRAAADGLLSAGRRAGRMQASERQIREESPPRRRDANGRSGLSRAAASRNSSGCGWRLPGHEGLRPPHGTPTSIRQARCRLGTHGPAPCCEVISTWRLKIILHGPKRTASGSLFVFVGVNRFRHAHFPLEKALSNLFH